MFPGSNADGQGNRTTRGSLRTRLLVALTGALVPVLVIAAFSAMIDARQAREERRQQLMIFADDAVDAVERSLETAEVLLKLSRDEIAAGNCKAVEENLKPYLPSLNNVVRFDKEGIATCSSVGLPGFEIVDPTWQAQLQFGTPLLRTDSFYGLASKDWMFAILARVDSPDGRFDGSVAFGLGTAVLSELTRRAGVPESVEVALADSVGRVHGSGIFATIDPEWIAQSKAAEQAQMFLWTSQAGDSRDVIVQPVGTENIYAVISRPSPGLISYFTISPVATLGLPILAFLAALLAVWLAVDVQVLRWLQRLQRAVVVYGAGRYSFQAHNTFLDAPEEIAELADAMDKMARDISERDAELRETIAVRDNAVKEIHHRVKNNLQIVTSFLSLQSRQLKDKEAREAIAAAQHRINALAIVHKTLYQTERIAAVELRPFLTPLNDHLQEALGMDDARIKVTQSYIDAERAADDAIPIALFIVEVVTNARKFAFDEKGGEITISLSSSASGLDLTIEDNGRGYDTCQVLAKGLGSRLMTAFARQLSAELEIESAPGKGCRVSLKLPEKA